MDVLNLHLVSDSTGETVSSVSRAAVVQFEDLEVEEHIWTLVRTKRQIDKMLANVKENPGFVIYTISNKQLRTYLKENCKAMKVPCVSALAKVIGDLSDFLGVKSVSAQPGKQHELDSDYFQRVEAINYTITHDDGNSTWDLKEADVILIGVSRTSKSPTCVYLANRGFKAGNIPYVKGIGIPQNIQDLKDVLIIGLTISADRLVQIRKNRLLTLNEKEHTNYVDMEEVKSELLEARRLCNKMNWPVIDITRKSVEETAATIIKLLNDRK